MSDTFDICITGSGVAGGILAAELAPTGKRIAIIEAGKRHDRAEMQRRIAEGVVEPYSMDCWGLYAEALPGLCKFFEDYTAKPKISL